MDKRLYDMGQEVNEMIVKAQVALAEYNFYTGNREGIAKQSDIDAIRDALAQAEYVSRLLSAQGMVLGVVA